MILIKEIINKVHTELEYRAAKAWARRVHPGWVYLATRHKVPDVRTRYIEKILTTYRTYIKVKE